MLGCDKRFLHNQGMSSGFAGSCVTAKGYDRRPLHVLHASFCGEDVVRRYPDARGGICGRVTRPSCGINTHDT